LEFAKNNYENYIYVSLEVDEFAVQEINRDFDFRPTSILKTLADYRKTRIESGKTLIIIDEIQNCERALTSLKYFA
jgi:predicted AAA+ superfamily ATPase